MESKGISKTNVPRKINPKKKKETRDITWLCCMNYYKPEARNEVIVYLKVALPFEPEDAKAREGVTLNASEPKAESKDAEKGWSTIHTRLGRDVKPQVLFLKEFGPTAWRLHSVPYTKTTMHNC